MSVLATPKIYHITHVNNLPQIIAAGAIWSDKHCIDQGVNCEGIASNQIKQERLHHRPVKCHPETHVGEYVPFYYCPRSVLLYIASQGNRIEYDYKGGQQPIIHLQFDYQAAVNHAEQHQLLYALSDRNAALQYAHFSNDKEAIIQLPWSEINALDFSRKAGVEILEKKMAEFLIYQAMPIHLMEKIGVHNVQILEQVNDILKNSSYSAQTAIERNWYF